MISLCPSTVSPFRGVSSENWKSVKRCRPPLQHRLEANSLKMESGKDSPQNDQNTPAAAMSRNAQKRLLKQQRYEAKKAEKKEDMKREAERKRNEWQDKLASMGEEERKEMIRHRRFVRKQRMEKWSEERGKKIQKLEEARIHGQNLVIDLRFSHLMNSAELHSLVQQIMYCYAMNARCPFPSHIWLTSCDGEMQNQLLQIPGFDHWVIEKEDRSYVEVFQDRKDNLVYLTADSENVLEDVNPRAIYIVGGLVDRNRMKGLTMKIAEEEGIKTAKLPIGTNYVKMSRSQVLTVNQVVEILLKFLETRDWRYSFFQVIPLRKRLSFSGHNEEEDAEDAGRQDWQERQCVET